MTEEPSDQSGASPSTAIIGDTEVADSQPNRPVADIFKDQIAGFSKCRLGKSYLRWTRDHTADDLTSNERYSCQKLVSLVNKALKA